MRVGKEEGAVWPAGGGPAQRPECGSGWFVNPRFSRGSHGYAYRQRRVFGPLPLADPFDDDDEAVRTRNNTVYGLAAGVWTSSIRRALTMSERLEAGTVW